MKTNDFNKEIETWKRAGKHEEQDAPDVSGVDISGKRSLNTIVHKIKRNFLLECAIVIIALAFIWVVSFLGIYDIVFNIWVVGFTIAAFIMAAYFYKVMFDIKPDDFAGTHLKDALKSIIDKADKCIRIYKQAQNICGYIFLPIVILLVYRYLFFSYSAKQDISLIEYFFTTQSMIFLGIHILLIAFYYKLVELYLKSLYGKHINSLKKLFEELNDEK